MLDSSARFFSSQSKDAGALQTASIYSVFGSLFSCAYLAWAMWVFPFLLENTGFSNVNGPLLYRTAPEVEAPYNGHSGNSVTGKAQFKGHSQYAMEPMFRAPGGIQRVFSVNVYRASLLRRV